MTPAKRPDSGPGPNQRPDTLTLLVDADDTLWENNIYFLEVTEHFLDAVEEFGVSRDIARNHLLETERRSVSVHGYGSRAFARCIADTFHTLAPHGGAEAVDRLVQLAHGIRERDQLELLPDVRETLDQLSRHCRLILLTKGDHEEQELKIERSGLRGHFEAVEVVAEKNEDTYRSLIRRLKLDPALTWMIGNSPKSDINPALAAGLNAVLVPHRFTWDLEIEEVQAYQERLVIADRFGDLVALFRPEEPESRAS